MKKYLKYDRSICMHVDWYYMELKYLKLKAITNYKIKTFFLKKKKTNHEMF